VERIHHQAAGTAMLSRFLPPFLASYIAWSARASKSSEAT
jgi:hypothetical protein